MYHKAFSQKTFYLWSSKSPFHLMIWYYYETRKMNYSNRFRNTKLGMKMDHGLYLGIIQTIFTGFSSGQRSSQLFSWSGLLREQNSVTVFTKEFCSQKIAGNANLRDNQGKTRLLKWIGWWWLCKFLSQKHHRLGTNQKICIKFSRYADFLENRLKSAVHKCFGN